MTDEARSRRTAALFVTLAATLWSTGGVGVKVTTGEPLVIAGLRSVFALLFMGGVLFVQTRFRGVPELLKRWRSWGAAVAYAFVHAYRFNLYQWGSYRGDAPERFAPV